MNNYTNSDYLQHFGVKGMKWGVRRYLNKDGSMTEAGKKRYSNKKAYEVETVDGDRFTIKNGTDENFNIKNKSKVIKTYGQHLYERDRMKLERSKSRKKIKKDVVNSMSEQRKKDKKYLAKKRAIQITNVIIQSTAGDTARGKDFKSASKLGSLIATQMLNRQYYNESLR